MPFVIMAAKAAAVLSVAIIVIVLTVVGFLTIVKGLLWLVMKVTDELSAAFKEFGLWFKSRLPEKKSKKEEKTDQ